MRGLKRNIEISTLPGNKSIAFVINSLEGGGAERVICNLLDIMTDIFSARRLKVRLILLDKLPEQQKCPHYVEKVTFDSRGKLLNSFFSLNQWVKNNRPDLLVSFLTRSNIISTIIGRRNNIPTIISERVNTTSHFSASKLGFVSRAMVRMVYPKASLVVPVSQGVMRDLVDNYQVPKSKCRVMYNAYDQVSLLEKANCVVTDLPKNNYIVGIGRLVPNKNFSLLLNAFAISNSQRDLVILGRGPEMSALNALSVNLNIDKRVHLLGFKENPYPYISNADYLISSSNAEGFPNGIVEAMCLGKPVIATNCESGPAELLTGDSLTKTASYLCAEYGILCPVNDVTAMEQAINVMENPNVAKKYQRSSMQRGQSFSCEAMCNTFNQLMDRVLLRS